MAKTYDQRALDKEKDPRYYDSYDRVYGWKCWYCRETTKEECCPLCGRAKEDAELKI